MFINIIEAQRLCSVLVMTKDEYPSLTPCLAHRIVASKEPVAFDILEAELAGLYRPGLLINALIGKEVSTTFSHRRVKGRCAADDLHICLKMHSNEFCLILAGIPIPTDTGTPCPNAERSQRRHHTI